MCFLLLSETITCYTKNPNKEREIREKPNKRNHQLLPPIYYTTATLLKQRSLSIITQMGENKEEEKKEETTEEKKEEEKKDEEPPLIVLKVDMHCEACARKVAKALKGFEGVEEVTADSKASKVVVKGKAADPIKVCERLQKKSGKKVELISPLPKPPDEKKEEVKEPQPEQKKEEFVLFWFLVPVVSKEDGCYASMKVTKQSQENDGTLPQGTCNEGNGVVLKVRMHCEACAQVIEKGIRKIKGVESVETSLGNDQVIVKGVIDPEKLVDYVYKRTKKQASVVKEEEKEKKEEEEKEEKEEKKEGEESKGDDGEEEDENKAEIKRSEYLPMRSYVDYFDYLDYPYDSQIFSDENPNACSVM
ncbi:Heavy metal-associated isoprenylated plant protein [Vigna angularis]|uniref:Heavy metal-associated isoprenylated plant protein n=1 Tax=Phaseolus angularis TaxID=3914 RepID=A0A8T0K7Q2_PHAAN|nr:Heavy metal-associated isoprenylated plant protein [Vigna angularis]